MADLPLALHTVWESGDDEDVAEITVEQIRALRERTGAGMMDVKRALQEAGGDEEEAVRLLREKGLAQAAKRSGRRAQEGLVAAVIEEDRQGRTRGALVELNCETDFVARTDGFRELAKRLVRHAARHGLDLASQGRAAHEDPRGERSVGHSDELLRAPVPDEPGKAAFDLLSEQAARLGERVRLRRYVVFEGHNPMESYIHAEGRIGVLIEGEVKGALADPEAVRAVLRELAMQVAAFRAEYVDRAQVPEDVKERERTIYRAAALNEGKPERVVDRIVEGRLEKFYQEACLLDQPYMRDGAISVRRYLEQAVRPLGGELAVRRFARFERAEPLAGDEE